MPAVSFLPPQKRIADRLDALSVPPANPLLVGFSGGPDSVALVLWLKKIGFHKLSLVHLDHGLREGSELESNWVKAFAKEHGFPAYCERVDVAQRARQMHESVEEAGRNARYALFGRLASKTGIPNVLLGHHADDQVETFLFRLMRGSGSAGLGAMDYRSNRNNDEFEYAIVRPMLEVWRAEILCFLEETGAAFLRDISNEEDRWTRNRIRQDLVPGMERVMRRSVREVLWRTAETLREENAYLDAVAAEFTHQQWLDVRTLRVLHPAMQKRVVHRWLRLQNVPDSGYEVTLRVLGLVHNLRPAKVNLPGSLHASRRRGKILITRRPEPRSNT
jgi:tRNA(Ile)-lysidine synthase